MRRCLIAAVLLFTCLRPVQAASNRPTAREMAAIRQVVAAVFRYAGPCMQYGRDVWPTERNIEFGYVSTALYGTIFPAILTLCSGQDVQLHYRIFVSDEQGRRIWVPSITRFGTLMDFIQMAEESTVTLTGVPMGYRHGFIQYGLFKTWQGAMEQIGIVRADEARMEQSWGVRFPQHLR